MHIALKDGISGISDWLFLSSFISVALNQFNLRSWKRENKLEHICRAPTTLCAALDFQHHISYHLCWFPPWELRYAYTAPEAVKNSVNSLQCQEKKPYTLWEAAGSISDNFFQECKALIVLWCQVKSGWTANFLARSQWLFFSPCYWGYKLKSNWIWFSNILKIFCARFCIKYGKNTGWLNRSVNCEHNVCKTPIKTKGL